MKIRALLAWVVLAVATVSAQTIQDTPNIGLETPAFGSNNWNLPLNYNFTQLDLMLSGNIAIPGINVEGVAILPQLTTWQTQATYNTGNVVSYQGTFYTSLVNSNQGNTPAQGSFWTSGGLSSVTSVFGRVGAVTAGNGDYTVSQVTGAAPLLSPTFTGIPIVPTAAFGTNTGQAASTAFVLANVGASPAGVKAEPYVAPSTGSSVTPVNTPLFLDAFQLSATAPETALNLCTANFFCDARSFGSGSFTTATQITIGSPSGAAESLMLPTGGLRSSNLGSWTGGMTDGTSDTVLQYGGTTILGTPNSGLGNQFRLRAGTSSSLNHIYETKAGANGENYFYACCMTVENVSGTGTATTGGAGSLIAGSADASVWEYMGFFDALDTYDLELTNNCCGPTVRSTQINGNYGSTPLYIFTPAASGGGPYNLNEISIVHPGPGDSAILQSDTSPHSTILNINNAYTETSTTDHTTTIASFSGAKSINIHNWDIQANYSGDGAPGITIANVGTPGAHFDGLSFTNGTGDWFFPVTSAIVDNYRGVTVPSDANGHVGMYDNSVTYSWGNVTTGHEADYEATIASASTIAPTHPTNFITGTVQINTITPPAGCTTSGIDCYEALIADPSTGPFTLGTSGNVASAATPSAGTVTVLEYRPATSKWYGLASAASGGSGFPITLGSTSVAASSTNATIAGLTLTGSGSGLYKGYAVDSGAANAYVITLGDTGYTGTVAGAFFFVKLVNASTASSTIAINGGSARPLKIQNSGTTSTISVQANGVYLAVDDGTNIQLNPFSFTGGTEAVPAANFVFFDATTASKQFHFSASGITASNLRNYTMPDASGTFPLLGLAQTFSATQTFSVPLIGVAAGSETVASSATPTFSASIGTSYMVMTTSVSTFTLPSGVDGAHKTICWGQGTGGFTAAAPTNVHGFAGVGLTASLYSCQTFVFNGANTIWLSDGSPGVINQ